MESPYPDVEQLRGVARRLLQSARGRDAEALARMPRSDREPQLADAQFAVARSVGFSSWPALVHAAAEWEHGDKQTLRTRLLLVRHPARIPDDHHRQHTSPGLSAPGFGTARNLATNLSGEVDGEVVAVLSSRRAPSVETAAILADTIGVIPEAPNCDLCDMHPGAAEGLAISEFRARYGGVNALVPGAETWRDVIARTAIAFRSIAERHRGQTVICVTELGVVRASLVGLGAADPRTANATPVTAGSITEWSVLVEGDLRRIGTWQLDRLNDTTALAEPETSMTIT